MLLVVTVSGCTAPEANTGKLVLQITDKPNLDIEKADVTITNVQVHVPSSGENDSAEWITIEEGPLTFDLIQIQDVEAYLGEKQLPVGRYTQIRMDVVNALVTVNGTVHNLTIPSKTVKLVKSFEIKAGETTTLTLDFDAQESIHESGKDRYIMRPTIKVITPDSGNGNGNGNGEKTIEDKCEESGGTVTNSTCCLSTEDFPDLCLIGPCGCAPEDSHEVQICDCGEGKCFNGNECVDAE